VYVNDIIPSSNDSWSIGGLKQYLHHHFNIQDLGRLKYFLGIEVARSSRGIHLSPRKYTLEIWNDVGLLGPQPTSTPMEQHLKLSASDTLLVIVG
jgi:hypothetical protein